MKEKNKLEHQTSEETLKSIYKNGINIEHKDKARLLMSFYKEAKKLSLSFSDMMDYPEKLNYKQASELLETNKYFNVLYNRALGIDLSSNIVYPALYDHHNGRGSAARVIANCPNKI